MKEKFIFALGPALGAFIVAITTPIMAWGVSPEDIGRFSLLQISIVLLVVLFSLGLDQAFVREFHSKDGMNISSRIINHLLPGVLLSVLIFFLGILFFQDLLQSLFNIYSNGLIFFIFITVFVSFILNFFVLHFRLSSNPYQFLAALVLPKFLFLMILLVFFYYGKNNFYIIVLALLLSTLSVFIFFAEVKNIFRSKIKLDFSYIKKTLIYSIPIMMGALLLWSTLAVDRFSLRFLSTLDELAIYTLAFTIAGIGMLLQNIFSMLWFPDVYKEYEETGGYKGIHKDLSIVTLLSLLLYIIVGIFAPILSILLPVEYQEVQFLVLASIAYPLFLVISEVSGVGLGLKKKMWLNLIAILIAFLTNILLNYLLVPIWGAKGAAISSAMSFYLYLILKTIFSSIVWINYRKGKAYLTVSFILISSIFYTVWADQNVIIFGSLFSLALVPMFFKNDLLDLKMFIIKRGHS